MNSESSDTEIFSLEFKVIVVGNAGVGKTSLIRRYCETEFGQEYKQTIGLDFYSKKVDLPRHQQVLLQIWDIGGQQNNGAMIKNYIMGAHAVCFVYDVTNASSFKDVESWRSCVYEALSEQRQQKSSVETVQKGREKGNKDPLMILVGNKTDLPNRQVTTAAHEKFAAQQKMLSCFVSARSGERINGLFTRLASQLADIPVPQQDVGLEDRVVANVDSNPEERVGVANSMKESNKNSSRKNKDGCALM
ncbi:ADP ribosylation factor family Ras of Complex Roc domain [Trypanosoma vivax]|uniref:Putative small GTP-binding protein Rab28 n=1 Tax=Trypanosoma vivax (strain Y486) TaxID=1055687 RepID=G0TWX4_TRYVY|nr:putative small GTP-binding protein Rab28 [Trypanosoma vivax]KAH8614130.1 ADP ribosylation factor family Ras of Complex Roc domain [Trypanosoma vivax]CCC48462.1 putative small GTP-binding protein Rab28 [Trypanosoma vivax Y486]